MDGAFLACGNGLVVVLAVVAVGPLVCLRLSQTPINVASELKSGDAVGAVA